MQSDILRQGQGGGTHLLLVGSSQALSGKFASFADGDETGL